MATKNWDNDFMSQLIDEQAWKGLSQDFQWSEQLLEKYADKVDWHEVSGNNQMLWTASMLEKFKKRINWRELSGTSHQCLLNADMLARFEQYWDWHELSDNSSLELTCELLDKFIERWDWREIIGLYPRIGVAALATVGQDCRETQDAACQTNSCYVVRYGAHRRLLIALAVIAIAIVMHFCTSTDRWIRI